MIFKETVKRIIGSASEPLTPQKIRSIIKEKYPHYYHTQSHLSNVQKGHYKDLDHALLAQIYSCVRQSDSFNCDTSSKPMRISLSHGLEKEKYNPPLTYSKTTINITQNFISSIKTPLSNSDDLVANLSHYYKKSLEVLKDFGGPSIYFHIKAIEKQDTAFLSDRHIEMVYATLASWGMHKMGDPNFTKAKLVNYSQFKNSILNHQNQLKSLSVLRMDSCTLDEYSEFIDQLEKIYYNLKVSISEATIVAHSKTLAHILPNLIPPIDRQYTIRFFTQENKDFFTKSGGYKSVNLPSGIQAQFYDFKRYCCSIKALFDRCNNEIFSIDKDSFNTSFPKIMDNLIMAYVKETPKSLSIR